MFGYLYIQIKIKLSEKIKANNKKGFNRISWELYSESSNTITEKNLNKDEKGHMVNPSNYNAKLFKKINGNYIPISEIVSFNVIPLREKSINSSSPKIVTKYWEDIHDLRTRANDLYNNINEMKNKTDMLLKSYERSNVLNEELNLSILNLRTKILQLEQKLNGSKKRSEIGEQDEYPNFWNYF